MRLGVDASFIVPGRVGGAEFMVKNLVSGLLAADSTLGVTVASSLTWETGRAVTWESMASGNRLVRTAEAAWRLRRSEALLATNYVTPPQPRRMTPPVVTIVHDLQYVHFPHNFSRAKRAWLRAAHLHTLARADRIVAISEHARDDLLRVYGQRWAGKIAVIPNPVSWGRFAAVTAPANASLLPEGRQVLLSVSAQWPHKNLGTLLAAHRLLAERRSTEAPALVLVGQGLPSLRGVVNGDGPPQVGDEDPLVIQTGHVSDAELAWWYGRADAFAFPSLFEGFGMPPVEAIGLGLPVLTTRCASIPEVTMGSAHYVDDPLDPQEWADRIGAILENPCRYVPDPSSVEEIRRRYDPKAIAARYLQVLDETVAAAASD